MEELPKGGKQPFYENVPSGHILGLDVSICQQKGVAVFRVHFTCEKGRNCKLCQSTKTAILNPLKFSLFYRKNVSTKKCKWNLQISNSSSTSRIQVRHLGREMNPKSRESIEKTTEKKSIFFKIRDTNEPPRRTGQIINDAASLIILFVGFWFSRLS